MLKLLLLVVLVVKLSHCLVRRPIDEVRGRFSTDELDWFKTTNVTYAFFGDFTSWEMDYIRAQMVKISKVTCLTFREITTSECDYTLDGLQNFMKCIRFSKGYEPNPCKTIMGNNMVVLPPHCFQGGWVTHEILHTMGFDHEQQRPDRDCFVEVDSSVFYNPNYKKIPTLDITFPYDFESVMHYRRSQEIRPAAMYWNEEQKLGSKDKLSAIDIITLNYMYCGGPHYKDIYPERYHEFYCYVNCNNCTTAHTSLRRNNNRIVG